MHQVFGGKVELDEKGYVKKYDECEPNVGSVFVTGDVYNYTYRQAVIAARSGCKAAIGVIKYFESKEGGAVIIYRFRQSQIVALIL